MVDNLDDLRDLIKKFADPEPIIEKKGKKEKVPVEISLHFQIRSLEEVTFVQSFDWFFSW